MRVAAIQLNSQIDVAANVERARRLVERAAGQGAQVIALPETFHFCGPLEQAAEFAEPIEGPSINAMTELALKHGVHILAGSIHEKAPDHGKPFNTSILIDDHGQIVARYRKIHLFDVRNLDMESHSVAAGDEVVTCETPFGVCGLSICYDLRFPELYREQARRGAEILFAPSAFTLHTGRDHWEVLCRARAIENLSYVVAPNQWGPHPPGKKCYGHSMIVDPWGTVLARAADGEGVIYAEIDRDRLTRLRHDLPSSEHRRLGLPD